MVVVVVVVVSLEFAEDLDDKRSLRKETVMTQQVVVYLPEVYNMN
jgi:hypothetical protein